MTQHLYTRTYDPKDDNNSIAKILKLVPRDSKVLDLGCGSGELGAILESEKGCSVTGVDFHEPSVENAKKVISKAFLGDVTNLETVKEIAGEKYDVILFADVLEHLTNPEGTLSGAESFINENGCLIMSIPNVTHGSVRLNLLKGNFNYTEEGLLDKTHLRFFSYKSLLELIDSANFFPVDEERTYLGVRDSEQPVVSDEFLTDEFIDCVETYQDATTLQFVIKVIPLKSSEHRSLLSTKIKNLENSIPKKSCDLNQLPQKFSQQIEELKEGFEKKITLMNYQLEKLVADSERLEQSLVESGTARAELATQLERVNSRIERYLNMAPLKLVRGIRQKLKGL